MAQEGSLKTVYGQIIPVPVSSIESSQGTNLKAIKIEFI